jgi:hypothetical protein
MVKAMIYLFLWKDLMKQLRLLPKGRIRIAKGFLTGSNFGYTNQTLYNPLHWLFSV